MGSLLAGVHSFVENIFMVSRKVVLQSFPSVAIYHICGFSACWLCEAIIIYPPVPE
jgi:hypothetical protein